jgi:hypothetical protein
VKTWKNRDGENDKSETEAKTDRCQKRHLFFRKRFGKIDSLRQQSVYCNLEQVTAVNTSICRFPIVSSAYAAVPNFRGKILQLYIIAG